MATRAESTQATRDTIVGTMLGMMLSHWYDEITLRDLADQSGVAVQTVINHFGTKEGILEAVLEDPRTGLALGGDRFEATADDIGSAVKYLMQNYEQAGDAVVRLLALEERIPALERMLRMGREGHRRWVEQMFPTALQGLDAKTREQRVLLLICATDVYTWRILRRDQRLSRPKTAAAIHEMVEAVYQLPRNRHPTTHS